MSDIVVMLDRVYDVRPEVAFAALADYRDVRPRILPPEMTDYHLRAGGRGEGSRFGYRFHATKKRVRTVDATVTEPEAGRQLLETDEHSSLAVRWYLTDAAGGRARVTVRVSWAGSSGVGGFFERRFAPAGIRRVYGAELDRLTTVLASDVQHSSGQP
jgi:polyketide cyclase/dehydrase/lipid transport protein